MLENAKADDPDHLRPIKLDNPYELIVNRLKG
jgi:hypothetical protein